MLDQSALGLTGPGQSETLAAPLRARLRPFLNDASGKGVLDALGNSFAHRVANAKKCKVWELGGGEYLEALQRAGADVFSRCQVSDAQRRALKQYLCRFEWFEKGGRAGAIGEPQKLVLLRLPIFEAFPRFGAGGNSEAGAQHDAPLEIGAGFVSLVGQQMFLAPPDIEHALLNQDFLKTGPDPREEQLLQQVGGGRGAV